MAVKRPQSSRVRWGSIRTEVFNANIAFQVTAAQTMTVDDAQVSAAASEAVASQVAASATGAQAVAPTAVASPGAVYVPSNQTVLQPAGGAPPVVGGAVQDPADIMMPNMALSVA
jgi:hypothetical protein